MAISRGLNGIGLALVPRGLGHQLARRRLHRRPDARRSPSSASRDGASRSTPWPSSASRWAASAADEARELLRDAKRVIGVSTFQVIVAQGIAGSIPWSALNFAAMWLELVGFITRLYLFATALGALFGGLVGTPSRGASPTPAIPLGAILLLALPNDPSTGVAHAVAFFVMGFAISWNASSTNNPIFAEIVPEKARTTVYALDKCFEAVFASFAPPIVGVLAKRLFGYKPVSSETTPFLAEIVPEKARTTVYALDKCFEAVFASFAPPIVGVLAERVFGYKPVSSETSVDTDRENAAALAKAVYAEIALPMAICCLTYTLLYCTYPRDRERARQDLLVASDGQLPLPEETRDSAVRAREDEESSVGSLNQRLLSTD
ncbi:hypothetical protein EJB05_49296, partial [Eragrostis curvula]